MAKPMFRALSFLGAWMDVEAEGGCDSVGGEEYRRVRGEWADAGCPDDVVGFIRRRANIDSRGNEPKRSGTAPEQQ